MPEGLDMAYVDTGGWTRQKSINFGASLLIQGAVLYALVAGLSVVIVNHPRTKTEAGNITQVTPLPPPPKPTDRPTQPPDTHPLARPSDTILIPLAPPSPGPTLLPPSGGPTAAPSEAASPTPPVTPSASPSYSPQGPRARNDPHGWASTSDYPMRDLAEGNEGTVRYEVSVGGDGRATACRVVGSSGHAGLDTVTCNLIMRRARFEPARDESGAKVDGAYTGSIRWQIPQE